MSVYSEYLSKMWKLDCNLVALRRRPAEQISYRVLIEPLSNVLVTRAPNVIIYKLLHRAVFFSRYELNFVALAMLKFSKFRGNMRFSMNQREKFLTKPVLKTTNVSVGYQPRILQYKPLGQSPQTLKHT